MFQRVAFGELSDFFTGLRDHLTDMTPVEILTLAPLAALVVVFGLFPGLVLGLVEHSVRDVLEAVGRQSAVEIAPQTALILVALPILYVVGRLIWVARIDLTGGGGSGDTAVAEIAPRAPEAAS
jgi:hypothetical protein